MDEDELIAFVRARLDEDEATAKAVHRHPGPWRHDEHSGLLPAARDLFDAEGGPVAIANGSYLADHIAANYPGRVLREVAFKRHVLAAHKHARQMYTDVAAFGCVVCHVGANGEDYNGGWCDEIRALAVIWNGHPDYRPGWELRKERTA